MKILPAAAREYIKFLVLVQRIVPSTPRNSGLGHTRCLQAERAASDERGVTLTSDEAFTQIFDNMSERTSFITPGNIRLAITNSNTTRHYPLRGRFWALLSTGEVNVIELDLVDKLRVASELSQACLLFLGTAWFSELCSCDLRCGTIPGHEHPSHHEFALQFYPSNSCYNPAFHVYGLNQTPSTLHTKSLRRLGLLLVEVWRLAPIVQIYRDNESKITQVTLREAQRMERYTYTALFEDSTFPAEYKRAIHHCMTADFTDKVLPSPHALEGALQQFYERVVKPSVHLSLLARAILTSCRLRNLYNRYRGDSI